MSTHTIFTKSILLQKIWKRVSTTTEENILLLDNCATERIKKITKNMIDNDNNDNNIISQ